MLGLDMIAEWATVFPAADRAYADPQVLVYHGDNMHVLKGFPDNCVDVIFTSPPYNTAFVGNGAVKPSGFMKESAMAAWIEKMTTGYSDTLPEEVYQDQQVAFLDECARVLKPGGSMGYNHKIRWRDKHLIHPLDWVRRSVLSLRMEIVWDRCVGTTLNARMFYPQDERIYWLYKDHWYWNQEAVGHGSIWRIPPQPYKGHACVFPEALVAKFLDGVAQPGGVVMDPYAGTGTTVSVARTFGCVGIGIEREQRYVDQIVDRLRQTTLALG